MNVLARAALGIAAMLLALGAGTATASHYDPGPGGCCTKPPQVAAAPATLRSTALAAR